MTCYKPSIYDFTFLPLSFCFFPACLLFCLFVLCCFSSPWAWSIWRALCNFTANHPTRVLVFVRPFPMLYFLSLTSLPCVNLPRIFFILHYIAHCAIPITVCCLPSFPSRGCYWSSDSYLTFHMDFLYTVEKPVFHVAFRFYESGPNMHNSLTNHMLKRGRQMKWQEAGDGKQSTWVIGESLWV